MGSKSVVSGVTGTDQTVSMNSSTWKSTINISGKKSKNKTVLGGTRQESTSGVSSGSIADRKNKTNRNIRAGRIFLALALVVSGIFAAVGSYFLMVTAEKRLAKNRFLSIVQRAEANAKWVITQKKQASESLAKMFGVNNPDASEWPFVYMEGYSDIASKLKLITKGSLSFCPIVTGFGENSEQKEFEDFYYNLYEDWGFPNGTAEHAFGKGIFGYGYDVINNKLWPDFRYPVLSNYTKHGTPNPENIIVPFVQSDFGYHSSLMLDTLFEVNRFNTAKTVIDCSEQRKIMQNSSINCAGLTDMIWQQTNAADVVAGPSGLIYSPIYPRNDPFELTGFILHKQLWHDLLEHAFESDISGIRVVLHTDSGREHSYEVRYGEVYYVGNRTHHCIKYVTERIDSMRAGAMIQCDPEDEWIPFDDLSNLQDDSRDDFRALNLSLHDDIFTDDNANYYMDIYATDEFVSQFGHFVKRDETSDFSGIPMKILVCLIAILVMVLTSALFIAYDYYVRQEFNAKNQLLEAKRRFVRFVSHEVRTPLNTVCMGLTLLENDLAATLEAKGNSISSSKTANHDKKLHFSEQNNVIGDGDIVVQKESIEDWLSLSTQVFQNADAAVGVLSDLLNYDKIQMGTLSLELSLMNLWAALEKTVEEFQMAATERAVSLGIDFSPLMASSLLSTDTSKVQSDVSIEKGHTQESSRVEKPLPKSPPLKASDLPAILQTCMVVGDKVRLTQVLRNLISNGLKFSKANTHMSVRVSIDPLPEHKRVQEKISLHKNVLAEVLNVGTVSVEVIDQGVGMTQEQVDTVFEDGTQFDANKLQAGGGSGLGLNIARGIVLEHGGSLTCSSKGIGKGTTFTLCTKLYIDENLPSPAIGISDKKNSLSTSKQNDDDEENMGDANFVLPKLHVLVVDDSLTNRKLCQRLLERSGHSTEGASNGEEAVEMVKESMKNGKYYDSILLDYEMPVMNGPDACRLIRKMGCSSYVTGVTGNVMSEDVDHFRSCGANWVMPKPFSLKAMEDQWVEDGVTPFNEVEESMVRVESSQELIKMGDDVALNFE